MGQFSIARADERRQNPQRARLGGCYRLTFTQRANYKKGRWDAGGSLRKYLAFYSVIPTIDSFAPG